jgi:branched-chain amino acid transport system permease protein
MRIGPGKPLLLAAMLALPVFLGLYGIHVAVLVLIFAILAIGLSLVMGLAGQVSLAQAAFFGAGAYGSAILTATYGWNAWLAAPVAVLGACAVALLVGLPALRVQSHYLGIVSLGLAVAFASLLTNATITGGASGISRIPPLALPGVDLTDEYNYYYLVLAVLAAALAFALFIARTTLGRRFRAMRDDGLAAGAAGIEIAQYRLIAFLLAGLMGGVAGVLYAHLVRYVSADTFSLDVMFLLLAMVVIGGRDSIWGAVVGAALLITARDLLTGIQTYQQLAYGSLIVATVVFAPQGLAGAAAAARRRLGLTWPAIPIPIRVPSLRRADQRAVADQPAPPRSRVHLAAGTAAPMLRVDGVGKRFRGLRALASVSLEVPAGEIHGVIGPNGSGKTTLFNVVSGIHRPSAGRVLVDGVDATGRRAHQLSRLGVARTFQNLRLFRGLTALENVMVALDRDPAWAHARYLVAPWSVLRAERERRREAHALLAAFGLAEVADEQAVSLPYGHQRRLEMARALAARPSLLLLDEPAAGLNAAEQEALKASIRRIRDGGVTVVVIDHNMALVMTLCDRVTVLAHGSVIASGAPGAVARDPAVIEVYLGTGTSERRAV